MKRSRHKVNLRLSFPKLLGGFYLVFLLGKDLRVLEEEVPEKFAKRREPQLTGWRRFFMVSGIACYGMIVLILFLYLVKTWAGFDLIKGQSPIPDFFRWIRLCH